MNYIEKYHHECIYIYDEPTKIINDLIETTGDPVVRTFTNRDTFMDFLKERNIEIVWYKGERTPYDFKWIICSDIYTFTVIENKEYFPNKKVLTEYILQNKYRTFAKQDAKELYEEILTESKVKTQTTPKYFNLHVWENMHIEEVIDKLKDMALEDFYISAQENGDLERYHEDFNIECVIHNEAPKELQFRTPQDFNEYDYLCSLNTCKQVYVNVLYKNKVYTLEIACD